MPIDTRETHPGSGPVARRRLALRQGSALDPPGAIGPWTPFIWCRGEDGAKRPRAGAIIPHSGRTILADAHTLAGC
jgi:hypothetical protein